MKTVTMEDLLSWAFVHELPKGGGVEGLANANSAWGLISELGVRVDRGSTGSAMGGQEPNVWIEQGEPHADALAVGEAVRALGGLTFALPPGWFPLADWADEHGLARAAVAALVEGRLAQKDDRRRGQDLVNLVVSHAILRKRPDWQAEEPKVRMVETGGTPAWFVKQTFRTSTGQDYQRELDGFNPKTRRPLPGAYRKFVYSDDVTGVVLSRLDWELWTAALARMHAGLADRLTAHRLAPAAWPRVPIWQAVGTAFLVDPVAREETEIAA